MSQKPAIDTDEIKIEIEKLAHFDQEITAEVPWHCIKEIKARSTGCFPAVPAMHRRIDQSVRSRSDLAPPAEPRNDTGDA